MQKILNILSEYNIWSGDYLEEGFRRQEYLDRIFGVLESKVIKVLIGQRRSGKSYILRQIINALVKSRGVNPGNIFYLNKEQLVFDEITDVQKLDTLFHLYLDTYAPGGKVYIFLDEVQNIRDWEKFVISYSQDFRREYEIFITGSNSQLLSSELSTLLSGRYVEIGIFPFSFKEFRQFRNLPERKQTFTEYLKLGGMPELLKFSEFESQMYYMESLKNTIILRDIVQRHHIKDAGLLEMIFKYLMLNIGNLTSISSIVKYFKSTGKRVNFDTISDYTDYLLQTMVLHSSERLHVKTKQVLKRERKFYLNDLSFRNFLYGETYFNPAAYLENYVYLTLLRKGFKVFVGTLRDGEIDFVVQKRGQIFYVQVAYVIENENTLQRETGNLMRIKDNFPKYLITLDDMEFGNIEGIQHLQAWKLEDIVF